MRQRVAERLSVAWITRTEKNPSMQDIKKLYQPFLNDGLNVRSEAWCLEGQSRSIPEQTPERVYKWRHKAAKDRRALAAKCRSTSLPGAVAWQRSDGAKRVYDEAMLRIKDDNDKDKRSYFAGYERLRGCHDRWEDVPVAKEVITSFLEEHDKILK